MFKLNYFYLKIVLLLRFCLLFLSVFLLNACSGNQAIESLFTPDPKLKENSTTANSSPNNSSNSTPIIDKNKLPENFPSQIPIYSPATLINTNGNKTTWNSSDAVNLISNFYQQEFTKQKWTISEQQDNLLIATNPNDKKQLKLTFLVLADKTEFTLEYPFNSETLPNNTTITNPTSKPIENSQNPAKNTNSTSYLDDLIALKIITTNQDNLEPNKPVTRREYARWLITANNTLYSNSPSLQIRLASENAQPVFTDVNNKDPDFAQIQGLAEAGLIPSNLTKNANAVLFYPDKPLNREDLIRWKVPLDIRQGLPNTSLEAIKETWGFQDATNISPEVWRYLYVDWQNGEQSNLKRAFGYTTLFQPKKPVTLAEAAAVLWHFGSQNEGVSASDFNSNTP